MSTDRSHPLLRWIFRRGNQLLTCQLTREPKAYMLTLAPHWDRRQTRRQRIDTGVSAFQRHAAVAATLREVGWKVVVYA